MSELYPIVRRARRPLVISDDDSGPPADPPPAVPLVHAEQAASYVKPPRQKEKHAGAAKGERKG